MSRKRPIDAVPLPDGTPAAVVPIAPARAAQAVSRGEIKLVEADATELRTLDGLLAQALMRLGRVRLDVLKSAMAPAGECAYVIEALRAEERYAAKVAEIGRANGVPIGQEAWTFDFVEMRFYRTPAAAPGADGARA